MQALLAGIFLFTAAGKLFGYDRLAQLVETRSHGRPIGMSRAQAAGVGLAEIAGAVGVMTPGNLDPLHRVVIGSAAWLALLMVAAGIYHGRRQDSTTPNIVIFLLALFVMVGRWPR
jgi:hypothetical protein